MVKKSFLWVSRVFGYLVAVVLLIIAITAGALEFYFLPNLNQYKTDIAKDLSKALGQKVQIGDIRSGWQGIQPEIKVQKIDIFDAQNRVALSLNDVETTLSWWSVPLLEPRLASLKLKKPELTIRREKDGTIFVAGINMSGPSKPEFANWLLKQAYVEVNDAKVIWLDDFRSAPALELEHVKLTLSNPTWKAVVGQHQLKISATPNLGNHHPIDINATVYGKDVSKINNWSGSVYGQLDNTDLAIWKPWVDYPVPLESGEGSSHVWLDFDDAQIKAVTADVELKQVVMSFQHTTKPAQFKQLASRIKWRSFSSGQELEALSIKMTSEQGVSIKNGYLKLTEKTVQKQPTLSGELALDSLDLSTIHELAAYLPLPADTMQTITQLNPQGHLNALKLSWQGTKQQLSTYSLKSQFSGLAISASGHIPGFTNFTGDIQLNEKKGRITVDTAQATMDFKKVLRWPIPAEKLSGQVDWEVLKDQYDIHVKQLAIDSVHIGGVINAEYQHRLDGNDLIDLQAKFDKANGQHAIFYFPTVLSKETLHWLDTSILSGTGENVLVTLKGRVKEFPWANNKNGLFQVKAKLKDALLDYGTGWPKLEGLALDLLFQGNRMELNANKGHFWGNQLSSTKVTIEDLNALHPVLNIKGNLEGPVLDTIRFINNSPVREVTEGFTEDLKTAGKGKLKLDLMIPLDNVDATKTKGVYSITNGTMMSDSIPDLTRINGNIEFTDTGLSAKNLSAWSFGGPAFININTGANHLIKVSAHGTATDVGIKQAYSSPVIDKLHGKADWQADISIQKQNVDIVVRSNLLGLSIDLPKPMQKTASETLPLKVSKSQTSAQQDILQIAYGNFISAKLLRTEKLGKMNIERGEIALNSLPQLPQQSGLVIKGNLAQLDADEWLAVFDNDKHQATDLPAVQMIDIAVAKLDILNRPIHQLKLEAKPLSNGWSLNVDSQEMVGSAQWIDSGHGKVIARLKTLKIPTANKTSAPKENNAIANSSTQKIVQYPDLDIVAEQFELGSKKMGTIELQASENNNQWKINKLNITTPHSKLVADGNWNSWQTKPSTQMNIHWTASNLGESLGALNYPDTIKNGQAEIVGSLKWAGSPHDFDYANLSGNFKLNIKNGQILKVQPGVGRLFSVLSLQNLPRRLTFDFRDVFSDGFAFDDISADATIDQGVLNSNNFKMKGATALVEMKGQTDLSKETQHLYVKVTPYISDTVSLAALAGGPAVAAAAYVAQKLLNDPLNKLARDKYEFVGTWDNPIEVNAKGNAEDADKPQAPTQIPGQ